VKISKPLTERVRPMTSFVRPKGHALNASNSARNSYRDGSAAHKTRLSSSTSVQSFQGTVDEAVADYRPTIPMYLTSPETLISEVQKFTALFPGEVVYAVKCNADKSVVQIMSRAGLKAFDVASMEEVRMVRKFAPKAKLYFMHPIKSPESIRESYFGHNVRAFVIDTKDELYKIMRETELASDLEIYVRLSLPKNKKAQIDFSSKFGAPPEVAAELLQLARSVGVKLGLCLHVGTQTTDPDVYKKAIREAAKVIQSSGVTVDVLDVGGGFPVEYPDQPVPDLSVFVEAIKEAIEQNKLSHLELMCEPGRALVARAGSLVVRVEGRKGDLLYINDGTYGGLFDAGSIVRGRFPVRRIILPEEAGSEAPARVEEHRTAFRFAGPTCDSIDMMEGPFYLPSDIKAGDYIEIGQMGAYSESMRTNFNGYGAAQKLMLYKRT
jgi:ornithine decarboxylase